MKSAYELAMERLGGELHDYSPDQKAQLAEIDGKIDAKIAQAKIRTSERLKQTSREDAPDLERELAIEIAGLNESRERQKETLRSQFGA